MYIYLVENSDRFRAKVSPNGDFSGCIDITYQELSNPGRNTVREYVDYSRITVDQRIWGQLRFAVDSIFKEEHNETN